MPPRAAPAATARPTVVPLLFMFLVASHHARVSTALLVSPATGNNAPLLGTIVSGGRRGGGYSKATRRYEEGSRLTRRVQRHGFHLGDGDDSRLQSRPSPSSLRALTDDDGDDGEDDADAELREKNAKYVLGLMSNLQSTLDGYILSGSPMAKERTYNILNQIGLHALPENEELVRRASRMMIRAGLPPSDEEGGGNGSTGNGKGMKGLGEPQPVDVMRRPSSFSPKGDGGGGGGGSGGLGGEAAPAPISSPLEVARVNIEARKREALKRKEWEADFRKEGETVAKGGAAPATGGGALGSSGGSSVGKGGGIGSAPGGGPAPGGGTGLGIGRSALSSRNAKSVSAKAEAYMSDLDSSFARVANDKKALEEAVGDVTDGGRRAGRNDVELSSPSTTTDDEDGDDRKASGEDDEDEAAASLASELVARAGAGKAFDGETMGIGGLDDVLGQVKRRVWVPLAAPPSLLAELGINPVRGLLLYGMPGCGKTLLARTLGKILSPARPITVVSGPEIMDKFVGSSEANLRQIFDNPPDIHRSYRESSPDGGEALARAALHVIVLDEFDAVARSRGGRGGKGSDQGDAGVARDSVVNQLLAKMDGVDELRVPTLVIGLTNRRSLIEPALLRSGRFEVQIEVPPPRTVAQRVSILRVHTYSMFRAGRVLVNDAPKGTAASRRMRTRRGYDGVLTYDELLEHLGRECKGMSGACLAGVCRAAASRALERAVYDFAGLVSSDDSGATGETGGLIADCLITIDDFEKAIDDVFESSRGGDGGDDWEITDDPNGGQDGEKAKGFLGEDVAYERR